MQLTKQWFGPSRRRQAVERAVPFPLGPAGGVPIATMIANLPRQMVNDAETVTPESFGDAERLAAMGV